MPEYPHTQTVAITKDSSGWGVCTTQRWNNTSPPCVTNVASNNLKRAIWSTIDWAWRNATQITNLTINGKPYPCEKIKAALDKYAIGVSTEDLLKHITLDNRYSVA